MKIITLIFRKRLEKDNRLTVYSKNIYRNDIAPQIYEENILAERTLVQVTLCNSKSKPQDMVLNL